MPATDVSPLDPHATTAILVWYAEHGRRLAFRRTSDPYAILVSEAMAQQTQAARAAERWERFMAHYPTVEALAAATPADVLREWRGLGYDRRGLNLWRAAREIVERHGGRVPSDLADLEALPGVGPYTARAVAAIAYGEPVGAVDTNVRRVLGRAVAGDPAALSAQEMQRIADAVVPVEAAGAWTHALMDLGATVCGPRRPDCDTCPARPWCAYAAGGSTVPARRVPHVRRRASPRPTAGCAAGSWTACAMPRWRLDRRSLRRSASTTRPRSIGRSTPSRRTVSSSVGTARRGCAWPDRRSATLRGRCPPPSSRPCRPMTP